MHNMGSEYLSGVNIQIKLTYIKKNCQKKEKLRDGRNNCGYDYIGDIF
jgi:hypothetical protein